MGNKGKEKAKAKTAAAKRKIARKTKRALAALSVCGMLAALVGCQTAATPSRSQSLTIRDCVFNVYGGGADTNEIARIELGTQAMSIESSGTETQTATPTQDVKPQTDIAVPINKAGAAQSVGSTLGDAVASMVNGLTKSGESDSASATTSASSTECADGSCDTCSDGSCSL